MVTTSLIAGDYGVPDSITDQRLTPTVEIKHAVMSVRLPQHLIPREAWRFDNVQPTDAKNPDRSSGSIKPEGGYLEAEWNNPRPGRASGIAWRL